jgi:hypothetical protein
MSVPDSTLPFPAFRDASLDRKPAPGRWEELHLYHGARCNRQCAFCCVEGRPDGGHIPFTEAVLRAAVEIVAPRGSLKIYGGEPTLDRENMLWSVGRLRELGFAGAITFFSNGIRARTLLDLLDSDPLAACRAVLNYSIATGRGERPLPPASLRLLQSYAVRYPDRLYVSHDFIIPVGRHGGEEAYAESSEAPVRCFHCFPVLTSAGRFHACPFAVEYALPHFLLGTAQTPDTTVQAQFTRFQTWMTTTLEPEAERHGQNACHLCLGPDRPAFPDAVERRGVSIALA